MFKLNVMLRAGNDNDIRLHEVHAMNINERISRCNVGIRVGFTIPVIKRNRVPLAFLDRKTKAGNSCS